MKYELMTGDLVSNVMPLGERYKIDAILKNKPVFFSCYSSIVMLCECLMIVADERSICIVRFHILLIMTL